MEKHKYGASSFLDGVNSFGDVFGEPILGNLDFSSVPETIYLVEGSSTQEYEGSHLSGYGSSAMKVSVEEKGGSDDPCVLAVVEVEVDSPNCSNETLAALCEEMSLSFDEEGVPASVFPSDHLNKLCVRFTSISRNVSNKSGQCEEARRSVVATSVRGALRALDALLRVIETVEVYPEYADELVDAIGLLRKEHMYATFDEMEVAAGALHAKMQELRG